MILSILDPRNQQTVHYDITESLRAQDRVAEISFLTSSKAPELFATFVRACFQLADVYSKLVTHHRFAERKMAERRAVVMLEEVPKVLADKKSSNAEMREAILDNDILYCALANNEIDLEGTMVYVRGKLHAMEEALNASKKVLADILPTQYRANPNLSTPGNLTTTAEVPRQFPPNFNTIPHTNGDPMWLPEELEPTVIPPQKDLSTPTLKIGKARY